MQNQIENNFGTLTKKKKKLYDITEILSSEKKVLDSLFKNTFIEV